MYSWKKLSSKLLVKHPRLTLYEDRVRLPSGHITDYLRYGETAGAACVIAVRHDGKILLQKEYSYPPNEWLYQLPGGALNEGEDPENGASREFAEEAGLKGKLKELGWFYVYNRRTSDKFYVYIATNLSETIAKKDIEEEFESYWLTVNEIDELVANGSITNQSLLSVWALYKSKNS